MVSMHCGRGWIWNSGLHWCAFEKGCRYPLHDKGCPATKK